MIVRGIIGRWLCVACFAASAVAATAPNIVLITVDTTRADRMGFLGSKRGLTPNLDALALQSAVFTHAYSQAPLTSVSHTTILTGTYPQYHHVLDFPMPLAKDLPFAPDILHSHGYRTAAFVGSVALDPTGAPGIDRGFDIYDAGFRHNNPAVKSRYETVERRGAVVVAHALAWLNEHPNGPFFLWVHLYDPHDPYDPPEPYKTKYASEPYDGEIAYADSALGSLFQELKTRGLYDDALIAMMSDHGESLGAHGEDTHGVFLYDETIHVPLVIKLPRSTSEQRVENRVELVDVMPTLLQIAGIAVPPEVQGESLLPLMTPSAGEKSITDAWRDRPAYAEADYTYLEYGWSPEQSLRTGKYLYVQAPRRELYDQSADPNEQHNLASQSSAVADTLSEKIEAFRQRTTSKREMPAIAVDASTQEKLASLGYVASTGKLTKPETAAQGPDPKDKIESANLIRRAIFLLGGGHYDEAIPTLQLLIMKEPDMATLYVKLGGSYMKLHQYDKAVPVLRKAVQLDPTLSTAQMDLGRSLLRTGDFNGAATVFETLLARLPALLDAHLLLEVSYVRADRVPETIKECRKVLQYLPGDFGSQLTLGEFIFKSGDAVGALPELQKASALRPNDPRPHLILARVYDQLGLKNDADRERAAAESLASNVEEEQ